MQVKQKFHRGICVWVVGLTELAMSFVLTENLVATEKLTSIALELLSSDAQILTAMILRLSVNNVL
eukprot:1137560-Pelagomonas_calceolata.AAC.1